jgi:pilus assembly protein FimV
MGVTGTLRKTWLLVLATALALLAGPALALGLGQIEVKSQRGQPFLAEIPIISSDPGELENLQARLASPDTFARIGLEPPRGIVTALQFTVALGPRGNPVIRVTSQEPVDESLLTFLLEVDWGEGRLVREYSALVDAPRTVSAPAQPPIQAATVASSNTIVRAPVAATQAPVAPPAEVPAPVPTAAAKPEPATAPAPPPVAATPEPAPPSNAVAPSPAPAAPAPERTAQPVAATPGEYGPVKVGDTLGKIASTIDTGGHSLDQTMLALLRANPDAFIGGNINLVKRGAVLRVPSSSELSQYSATEARAIVHEQVGQWREMRKPAVQPAVAAADAAPSTPATAVAGTRKTRADDARLEIVPPSANGARQAGTQSGINAGGEGDMLRQEMQQTKETLAARDAEVQELKTRVADLEKLQQDQQQLLALKDSKLAEAQQALAARQATAATATTTTTPAKPAVTAESSGTMFWPWAIAALVIVLVLAWLFMRRKPVKPARPVFDTSRLAASIPAPVQADEPAQVEPDIDTDSVDATVFDPIAPAPVAPTPAATAVVVADAAVAPTWHAGGSKTSSADAIAPLNPAPAGQERLELARAYLDLGDVDTARSLLQEVADSGDAAARGEAARLLRELV